MGDNDNFEPESLLRCAVPACGMHANCEHLRAHFLSSEMLLAWLESGNPFNLLLAMPIHETRKTNPRFHRPRPCFGMWRLGFGRWGALKSVGQIIKSDTYWMAARGKKYTQSHKSQVPDKKQGATSGVQYIKSKSNKSTLLYFAQCFPSCIYLHLFSILLFHVHNRAKAQNSAPVKLNPCFMSIQSTLSTFPSVVYEIGRASCRERV